LVYFVLLIRHSGMDLNIINFLKEDIYIKQELVTLGALTKCVLLNFLYVSVFFLFCMSLLCPNAFQLSTQIQTTPH
jgi:hypothetical protein